MKHDEFLLDLRREASSSAPSIDQEITDECACCVRIVPTLGQGIRNARDRVRKMHGSRIRSQIYSAVDNLVYK